MFDKVNPVYRLILAGIFLSFPFSKGFGQSIPKWKAPAEANKLVNPVKNSIGKNNTAPIEETGQLYLKMCADCHGKTGMGDGMAAPGLNPKPKPFADPVIQKQKDGALFWKLTEGRGRMPSYRRMLTDTARWLLINFIRKLKNEKNIALPPPGQPIPAALLDKEGFQSLYDGTGLAKWDLKPGHRGHWTPLDWRLDYDGKSEEKDKSLWSKNQYADFILIADVRLTRKPELAKSPVILPNGDNALNPDCSPEEVEVPYAGDTGIYLRGDSKSQVNIGNRYIGSGEIYGYRVDKTLPAAVRAAVTPKIKADKPPGEWNRFIITLKGERVTVVLNNVTVVQNALLPGIPQKGAIALQDDHASNNTFQFANLYIKEL
ncbi:family 16 glycoside hydrolase [Flavitalea flava]